MSDPVVVNAPAGRFEADRAAVEWLWEMLDAHALPATREAFDKGLNGYDLTLPEGELPGFCSALGQAIGRLDPSSPHIAALAALQAHACPG